MSRIHEPIISHSEMAMPLPSTFSEPERRRKVTTYGRPGRHPSTAKFFADTPSPERPRKQPKTVYAAVRKPAPSIEIQGTLAQNHRRQSKSPAPLDIFDVPSDHESTSAAPPEPPAGHRRRILPKSEDPGVFDILSSDDDGIQPARKTAKQVSIPSDRKPTAPLVPVHRKSTLGQNGAKQIVAESNNAAKPSVTRKRAKTPQVTQEPPSGEQNKPVKRTTRSRATTPALSNSTSQVKHNSAISGSSKPTVKKPATANKPPATDIFDVPSSDESEPCRTTVKSRTMSIIKRNVTTAASHTQTPLSPTPSMESDVSQKSNKRKRRASVSSTATVKASAVEQKTRESNPQRERKHQKKTSDASSGMPSILTSRPNPSIVNPRGVSAINEPKRTRTRTAPVKQRTPVIKGQSSPAKLHTMLVHRTASNQPRIRQVLQAPESDAMEDDTMCEPQSTRTPPIRTLKTSGSGSVTPRQQALFSNLLGDSSDSATPMPKLSDLKISERKPSPAITNLMRSVSDIPQSAHTRKTRLLDVLKRTASSSEEDSETDEETEDEIISIPQVSVSKTTSKGGGAGSQLASTDKADAMDIDTEPIGDSQNSQTSIHLHTGGRITYAKNRSYLEDTEPDLANLLDNMDDDLGLVLPKNQEVESDVDEEGGHLRDIHDLRRQGQQHKFQTQAEATIEEVAGTGLNASQRRSAMMECATQVKDKNYVSQLLESSLMSSLIQSISSTGEIIFDFAAAAAVLFILEVRPDYAVLKQIHQSAIIETLGLLLSSKHCSMDIHRISKERKTNMAPRARETVAEFRGLILDSNVWPLQRPDKVSPQLIAIKVLELLTVQLRQAGNKDSLFDQQMVSKIVDLAVTCCTSIKAGKATPQDYMTLEASLSMLESLAVSTERMMTWPASTVTRLADLMPIIFEAEGTTTATQLAIRLCINITNDRPKTCQLFSKPTFVLPLLQSIGRDFELLGVEADERHKNEIMENLIFSLGAMMNLAESSKQVRTSAIKDGGSVVNGLVNVFLKGSELAEKADSIEESHFIVRIGYLTVLLGNLCLDNSVRQRVCEVLPGKKLDMLIQKIREFVLYNKKVDRLAGNWDGEEGEETYKNFTARLMTVVERLEGADGS